MNFLLSPDTQETRSGWSPEVTCQRGSRMADRCLQTGSSCAAGGPGNSALQSQKAVTAYLSSKQLLPFGFARQLLSTSLGGSP